MTTAGLSSIVLLRRLKLWDDVAQSLRGLGTEEEEDAVLSSRWCNAKEQFAADTRSHVVMLTLRPLYILSRHFSFKDEVSIVVFDIIITLQETLLCMQVPKETKIAVWNQAGKPTEDNWCNTQ